MPPVTGWPPAGTGNSATLRRIAVSKIRIGGPAAVGTENYVASRWSSHFRIARFVSSGFSCWIQ